MGLKCGTGKYPITPDKPCILGGYAGRESQSCGKYDDLYASVIYIQNEIYQFLIITYDLLGIDNLFCDKVKNKIFEKYRIPKNNIIINATHTHSGPEGFPGYMKDGFLTDKYYNDEAYTNFVIQKTLEAVSNSSKSKENVYALFSKGKSRGLYSNRTDGSLDYDNDVFILRFISENNKTKAVVVNFSCHPTVLGNDNLFISTDFIGFMRQTLSDRLDKCTICVLNGCAGDISTRYTRRSQDIDEARRIGNELALQIEGILSKGYKINLDSFNSKKLKINFPRRNDIDINDIKLKMQKINESINCSGYPEEKKNLGIQLQEYENAIKIQNSKFYENIVIEFNIISLGDLSIITIPGEPCSKIGIELKKILFQKPVFVAGYCEDYKGYIISEEEYKKDGYENLVTLLPYGSAEYIIEKLAEELKNCN